MLVMTTRAIARSAVTMGARRGARGDDRAVPRIQGARATTTTATTMATTVDARATRGGDARGVMVAARARGDVRARATHESGVESVGFFTSEPEEARTMVGRLADACAVATGYFPVYVALGAVLGLAAPASVSWFRGDAVTYALAVTMLGMGITLDTSDFSKVFSTPWKIGMGVALQYTVMPSLAFLVGHVLLANKSLAAGLILVGCCPGGTASNVVTYLARASVPLSVVLTTVSTFMATVMTPTLTQHLAGTMIPVDGVGLFLSTCKVVLLPVLAGVVLKKFARKFSEGIEPFAPIVAVLTVALICSSIIGRSADKILAAGPTLIGAVVLLHSLGFGIGYFLSRAAGFSTMTSRTMSIEVGMQNSALGVVLASAHFADPLVAVPCAISATVHSVIGSMLAGFWRYRDDHKQERYERWRNDPNYSAYNDTFRKATGLGTI